MEFALFIYRARARFRACQRHSRLRLRLVSMSRFVYGSLMAPEVLSSLLGRVPPRAPACVRGFHRYRIRDRVYPAIARHEDGGRVDGYLLSSLTSRELAVLDWFEDEAYVMRSVRVELADGANAETIAYVYEDTRNLHGTWDYDEFRHAHLDDYLVACDAFAEDIRDEHFPGDDAALSTDDHEDDVAVT